MWQSGDPILGKYLDGKRGMGGVFAPQNLALYSYTWNNPVKYIDPDGKAIWVPIIIGVGLYLSDVKPANAPGPSDVPTSESVSMAPQDLAVEAVKQVAPESTHTAIDVVSTVGNPKKAIQGAGDTVRAITRKADDAGKIIHHPSERAARRAAERESGMGKHGGREQLPDQKLRPGSQAPQGDPGVRTEVRSTDTGRVVHHDPYGHRDGNIPPHYGVSGPGVNGTTHHTYPSQHDPSTNR